MLVRIAVFLIVVWLAMVLLRVLLSGFVHLLIVAAIVFLILKVLDRGQKTTL